MSSPVRPAFGRMFAIVRDEDVTGVSGTGTVAEGCVFSDGWAVTHWLDRPPMHEPTTTAWYRKGDGGIVKIHGHGGATRLVWADQVPPDGEQQVSEAQQMDVSTSRLDTGVIHACPPDGSGFMPCCDRTPFEALGTDRMTTNPAAVTCNSEGCGRWRESAGAGGWLPPAPVCTRHTGADRELYGCNGPDPAEGP